MKTKFVLLLCASVIFAVVSGCSVFFEPVQAENTTLVISVGLFSPDSTRMTYSPEFDELPLSMYEKIILEIDSKTFDSTNPGQTVSNNTWIIELPDVPYGVYTITAKAYLEALDSVENYSAFGEAEFNFTAVNTRASVVISPVFDEGEGTLVYTLTDPDDVSGPVSAKLYKLTMEEDIPVMTFETNLVVNGQDEVLEDLDAGFYLLEFGYNVPSVIHIYKNMETKVEVTNNIFNIIIDESISGKNMQITTRAYKVLAGNTVTLTITGQYKIGSVTLNGGFAEFTGNETFDNDTYTRTFTMPSKSVIVNADMRTSDSGIEFWNPNEFENLRFVLSGSGTTITTVSPGQTIAIKSGENDVSAAFWYLDSEQKAGGLTFTVPSEATANYVGALVFHNGTFLAPFAIPIMYP